MRRNTVARLLVIGCAATAALTLGACGYHGAGPRYSEFASNPTPYTQSLAYWPVERHSTHRHTEDTNGRAFWDDVDRLILRNRPSRMTVPPNAY
ncbi:MAG: hypothetical protein KDA20_10775 [Phycisphaerales bacterium]|nr:hypothetical protein [Phycisphaerales bacterium]